MRHIYTVDKYILNIIGDMVELFEGYGTVPVRYEVLTIPNVTQFRSSNFGDLLVTRFSAVTRRFVDRGGDSRYRRPFWAYSNDSAASLVVIGNI